MSFQHGFSQGGERLKGAEYRPDFQRPYTGIQAD